MGALATMLSERGINNLFQKTVTEVPLSERGNEGIKAEKAFDPEKWERSSKGNLMYREGKVATLTVFYRDGGWVWCISANGTTKFSESGFKDEWEAAFSAWMKYQLGNY